MTVYSEHGSPDNLDKISRKLNFSEADELRWRIQLAIDYLNFLDFIHNSPIGTRVMCDGYDIKKLMSQFLIQDDLRLIANDLDMLPEIANNTLIKCTHRDLRGLHKTHKTFIAPEELWPWPNKPFNKSRMPGHTEKVDIWRVPDVLVFLLGNTRGAKQVRAHCVDLFKRCQSLDPTKRPNSSELMVEFFRVLKYLKLFRFDIYKKKMAHEAVLCYIIHLYVRLSAKGSQNIRSTVMKPLQLAQWV